MKRLKYLLIPAIVLLLAGCDEPKKMFEDSAAVRMQKAIDAIDATLLDSENGWIMQYFPQTDLWGGFNMHIEFNDDKTANIELLEKITHMPEDLYATSGLYEVKADQSVMLTFDTGNEALQYFRRREGGLALKADYEFLPQRWENDFLLLKGKQFGALSYLDIFPAGETVDDFREKIDRSRKNMEFIGYKLNANDNTYDVGMDFAQRQITYMKGAEIVRIPYVYTPEGVKFNTPVTIDGVEVSELQYDGESKFTNAQGNVELEKFRPSNYAIFTEKPAWYFADRPGMMSDSFRAKWNRPTNTSGTIEYAYFNRNTALAHQLTTTVDYGEYGMYTVIVNLDISETGDSGDKVNMKFKLITGSDVVFRNSGHRELINAMFDLPRPSTANANMYDYEEAAKNESYTGETYIITLDDPDNPKELILTAENDPDYWFRLTEAKTLTFQN